MLVAVDGDPSIAGQARFTADDRDAVLLEQPADTPGQSLDDLVPARDDRVEVHRRVADVDAEFGGTPGFRDDVGGAQHELGRDAGVVETAAAEAVPFDHRGPHAELRRPDRGDVAAGTGADDDAVELTHDPSRVTPDLAGRHCRIPVVTKYSN